MNAIKVHQATMDLEKAAIVDQKLASAFTEALAARAKVDTAQKALEAAKAMMIAKEPELAKAKDVVIQKASEVREKEGAIAKATNLREKVEAANDVALVMTEAANAAKIVDAIVKELNGIKEEITVAEKAYANAKNEADEKENAANEIAKTIDEENAVAIENFFAAINEKPVIAEKPSTSDTHITAKTKKTNKGKKKTRKTTNSTVAIETHNETPEKKPDQLSFFENNDKKLEEDTPHIQTKKTDDDMFESERKEYEEQLMRDINCPPEKTDNSEAMLPDIDLPFGLVDFEKIDDANQSSSSKINVTIEETCSNVESSSGENVKTSLTEEKDESSETAPSNNTPDAFFSGMFGEIPGCEDGESVGLPVALTLTDEEAQRMHLEEVGAHDIGELFGDVKEVEEKDEEEKHEAVTTLQQPESSEPSVVHPLHICGTIQGAEKKTDKIPQAEVIADGQEPAVAVMNSVSDFAPFGELSEQDLSEMWAKRYEADKRRKNNLPGIILSNIIAYNAMERKQSNKIFISGYMLYAKTAKEVTGKTSEHFYKDKGWVKAEFTEEEISDIKKVIDKVIKQGELSSFKDTGYFIPVQTMVAYGQTSYKELRYVNRNHPEYIYTVNMETKQVVEHNTKTNKDKQYNLYQDDGRLINFINKCCKFINPVLTNNSGGLRRSFLSLRKRT